MLQSFLWDQPKGSSQLITAQLLSLLSYHSFALPQDIDDKDTPLQIFIIHKYISESCPRKSDPRHHNCSHILSNLWTTARRLISPQINYNIVPFGVFPSLSTNSFSQGHSKQVKSLSSQPASQICETGHHYHLPRWEQSFHNVHIYQIITMYILNIL